jgi:hypothetical protein
MTIKALFQEFDPHKASEIILDTSGAASDRTKHLAFNMFLAWALWPGRKPERKKTPPALRPGRKPDAQTKPPALWPKPDKLRLKEPPASHLDQ